jgi:Mn-containing catalase
VLEEEDNSSNRAIKATVSYLIVRDLVHEKVFAKALETLDVNWGKALPVPRVNTNNMPEVKDLENKNLHNIMWSFTNNGDQTQMGWIRYSKGSHRLMMVEHWK